MKITILKPDHLGDLVLSVPAINKLQDVADDISLFCNPASVFLAKYLFPKVKIFPISFPHLSKNNSLNNWENFIKSVEVSDILINLRADEKIENDLKKQVLTIPTYSSLNSLNTHETNLQQQGIQELTGSYDSCSYFYKYGFSPKKIAKTYNNVGLVISAGFFNNSLSLYKWHQIANYFINKHHSNIFIIAGPAEANEARILGYLIKSDNIIIGGNDLTSFLEKIEKLDVLIATDSGTAHICSISGTPIISLFGPSPHKRYRPIGPFNKIVSLEFNCSPCPQFEEKSVNKCLTKECLSSIQLANIISLLEI